MKWLRELDLYKSIIFASLLLLPAVGGWACWLQGRLETAQAAIDAATKPNGDLEEIGKYMKGVEEQRKSNATQQGSQEDPGVYFQQRIFGGLRDTSAGALKRTDFSIIEGQPQPAGKGARDRVVTIDFKRGGKDRFPLTRSFLLAVLFNCEAGSPIWRLRELKVRNASMSDPGQRGNKAPPPETVDEWMVEKLVFASRAPDK